MDFQAMVRVMKYHCKTSLKNFLWCFILAYLGSALVVFIVMTFAKPDTYINLSSVILAFTLAVNLLIFSIKIFATGFNEAVKLGISRKNFLASAAIFHVIIIAVLTVGISLIARFEVMFNGLMYSKKATLEVSFEEILLGNEALLFPIGLAIVVIGIAVSAVMLKFGGKGILTIYVVFVGSYFLVRPALEAFLYEKQNTVTINFLEPIGRLMSSTSSKFIVAVSLALVLLGISLYWLLRYDVRQ